MTQFPLQSSLRAALRLSFLGAVVAALGFTATADAQFYRLHQADMGGAATGEFTTTIQSNAVCNYPTCPTTRPTPYQVETNTTGAMFTLRDHPVSWAGIELNYQYAKFTQRFTNITTANGSVANPEYINNVMHEASAAYLLHLKTRHGFQPFVAIGGGGLDFAPLKVSSNQWRGAGLVDVGFDYQTVSRLGFRFGARDLIYRSPTFYTTELRSFRWVSTEEPYAGVYVRF